MASLATPALVGILALVNLGLNADLVSQYAHDSYPGTEARDALILALVVSVWGIMMACKLFDTLRDSDYVPSAFSEAIIFLLVTFILNLISASVLANASIHGGACVEKAAAICKLYTASLILNWLTTMVVLALLLFATRLRQRSPFQNYLSCGSDGFEVKVTHSCCHGRVSWSK